MMEMLEIVKASLLFIIDELFCYLFFRAESPERLDRITDKCLVSYYALAKRQRTEQRTKNKFFEFFVWFGYLFYF